MLDAYDAALERLRGLGALVETFAAPADFERMKNENGRLIAAEGWFHQGHLFGDPSLPMDEDVRPALPRRPGCDRRGIPAPARRARRVSARFIEAMRGFDAIADAGDADAATASPMSTRRSRRGTSPGSSTISECARCRCRWGRGGPAAGLQVAARGRRGDGACGRRGAGSRPAAAGAARALKVPHDQALKSGPLVTAWDPATPVAYGRCSRGSGRPCLTRRTRKKRHEWKFETVRIRGRGDVHPEARPLRSLVYSGRRCAEELLARLHAAPKGLAGDAEADAKGEMARALVRALGPLVAAIRELSSRIEHAVEDLPDGRIVMSFPRAGRIRGPGSPEIRPRRSSASASRRRRRSSAL